MSQEEHHTIFRQKALDQFASLDQFEKALVITNRKSWLILSAICLIFLGLLGWGIFGKIPVRVRGEGILLTEKGSLYNAVAPEGAGRIIRIAVNPGEMIKQGDIIAYLDAPGLTEQLHAGETYLAAINKEYKKLSTDAEQKIKQREKNINDKDRILQRIIQSEEEKLNAIIDFLNIKKTSFKQGIITKEDLMRTQQDFYETKKNLEQTKERFTQNKIALADFVDQWQQRLRDLDLKIKEQQHELATIQSKLTLGKEVKSPIDGIVVDILATVGEKVEGGKPVATLSTGGQGLDAIIYVPGDQGKLIKTEMQALISPTTIKRQEYGSIRGKVSAVSRFPSSPKAIHSVLQNEELVKKFTEKGTPIAIRVLLLSDPNTFSHYQWSSSQGPNREITPGTLVEAMITTEEKRPISLLIPSLKALLGQ